VTSIDTRYSKYATREELLMIPGRAFAQTVKTARDWLSRFWTSGGEFLGALEPWRFETIDFPELRKCSAAERSTALAAVWAQGRATQTYQVVVMETDGPGERSFTFEDSPALFDRPVDQVAEAILSHVVLADQLEHPLRYCVSNARRHGDVVMIDGTFPVIRGALGFIALASAS
jgi:hypothetical protein